MWPLVVTITILVAQSSAQYYGNYYCKDGKDVFVQLFEWKWKDISNECENFLAQNGFCAVQISPPQEHRLNTNPPFPWWQRYQPVSYKMDSRSGSEAEFREMVKRCNDVGVWIYADIVVNHMTGGGWGTGSAGSDFNADTLEFPGVPYGPDDFHGPFQCHTHDLEIRDYNNANEVRYCRLEGLRDLRHGYQWVDDKIIQYLNKLISWGVAGFRFDASKHMFPHHIQGFLNRLDNLNTQWFPANIKPFAFTEVIDLGGEAVSASEYVPIARVTEFKYGMFLGDVFRGNNGQRLAYLKNFGEGWGFMSGLSAVAFMDNHDNQRGHGAGGFSRILTFFEDHHYKMANAFQLAWPFGYVRLMSSYRWPRDIQNGRDVNERMGPPSDSNGNTEDVRCFDNFICEHRWRQITNMVKFHNAVAGTDVVNWWDNGFQAIAFARGDRGFIVINNEQFSLDQNFNTNLPDGEYCDVITCENNRPPCSSNQQQSECRGSATVTNGWARIRLPNDANPVFAMHV